MMIEEIQLLESTIFKEKNLKISMIEPDAECEEYFGYNFQLNQHKIKFRKAKITPKKIGQFVTLWKRNRNVETEPFLENDDFDFYIIFTNQKEKSGFFIFPKSILAENNILSTNSKIGKRGFRLYSEWDFPENKQAEKTKNWQTDFFVDLMKNKNVYFEKFENIWSNFIKINQP